MTTTQADQPNGDSDEKPAARLVLEPKRRLSSKLLWLTVLFVMIAEVLIFVPSVANFRINWLDQRLNAAAATSVLITQLNGGLPQEAQDEVLMATGAKAIALRRGDRSQFLVVSEMPPDIYATVRVDDFRPLTAILGAFDTMLSTGERYLLVIGPIGETDGRIQAIFPEEPLREAMLIYARNVALISVIIALITAALVFMAINRIMIHPIRELTRSMLQFANEPELAASVITPTGRDDELGIAEIELADMQSQLQSTLKGKKRLADLGLAVSKINHDMRNILASAQLISDRLSDVDDPVVQRFAPKLVRTIDRAVSYTSDVLAYGPASEQKPNRRRVMFSEVVGEVEDVLGLTPEDKIEFSSTFEDSMEIDADPEQLFRVLTNLSRNAIQAMRADDTPATVKRLSITAGHMGSTVLISVQDTGPGLPPKARENLFSAFKGSARAGGTGLGLAICHELITAHGGTIELRGDNGVGTQFEIRLPQAPVSLAKHRESKSA